MMAAGAGQAREADVGAGLDLLAAFERVDVHGRGEAQVLEPPEGALALALVRWAAAAGPNGLVHVARSEARAERLALAAEVFAGAATEVLLLPPWDCLPFDRVSPSASAMGRRIAALARLALPVPTGGRLLLASVEALLQRVPPCEAWHEAVLRIAVGQPLSAEALRRYALRAGYVLDERVDEPGEVAIRGGAIDIFPADATQPVRVRLDDAGAVVGIDRYDPATQRTEEETAELLLRPASEVLLSEDLLAAAGRSAKGEEDAGDQAWGPGAQVLTRSAEGLARRVGLEHRLWQFYPRLETLFDRLPDAALVLDPEADERVDGWIEQVADAHERRQSLRGLDPAVAAGAVPPSAGVLYMDKAEWTEQLHGRPSIRLVGDGAAGAIMLDAEPAPRFAREEEPARAFGAFVHSRLAAGDRLVLAAASETELRRLLRPAERHGRLADVARGGWADALASSPGSAAAIIAALGEGFSLPGLSVVTSADVFGERLPPAQPQASSAPVGTFAVEALRPGDLAVHAEHGIGRVIGLQRLQQSEVAGECLVMEYAAGQKLLVPVEEIGAVWRYAAGDAKVPLDRLNGEGWAKRRAEVEVEVAEAAAALIEHARAREQAQAPRLAAPRAAYQRFAGRFPFAETADQRRAIDAVAADLASGRRMDRLVCGDVGFGKTEVALRAAAIAALAGKQVAVVAPTTVLVRQHLETFRRRFAGFGLRIESLARNASAAAGRAVLAGLADGSVRIVIGTHALAGDGVRFRELGLLVIDEEQRFGTRHKQELRGLGDGTHVLTLTATPIPRTLQAARAGLIDLSVIATPPVRRRPVRTFISPFDEVVVRAALLRESRHGGQSFVVCPRIADLEPMRARLAALAPELDTVVAHGRMRADALDEMMVRFADGEHDVLLTTNIIESGLDIPSANTMLVWRPDRFGLTDLHQLRGRVGRGRARGTAYLLLDPRTKTAEATGRRLRTLQSLEGLGSGFAVGARDLDVRGAGDLLGEEQSGHLRLVGTGLYQHLFDRALRRLRGEADDDWSPELRVGLAGHVPAEHVPEEENRVELYRRLAALRSPAEIAAFEEELADRFGEPPPPLRDALTLARLRERCRAAGIARLDAGPNGVAVRFHDGAGEALRQEPLRWPGDPVPRWSDDRLVLPAASGSPEQWLQLVEDLLAAIEATRAEGRPGQ